MLTLRSIRWRPRLAPWNVWLFLVWLGAGLVSAAAAKKAAAPAIEFAPPGGVYTNAVKVTLAAAPGAVIRYTTDGTEPQPHSPRYRDALDIDGCALLRARAFPTGGLASATVTHSYVLIESNLTGFSSDLPLIVINSALGEVERDDKMLAALHVLENRPERTTLPDRSDFTGLARLNIRGYSSLRYPKHSFTVKLVNERGEAQKSPVLGLPKESDWILYGPYPDKTLLRDVLAYELNRQMGHWAPRTRFVEVFLNEASGRVSMENYVGLYVFEEKVTRDKSRVAVTGLEAGDLRSPEITGGYIFKKDHAERGERRRFDAGGPPMAFTTDRAGFPSGPGGFPGDPAGFLPPRTEDEPTRSGRGGTSRPSRLGNRLPVAVRPITNHVAGATRGTTRVDWEETAPDPETFVTALQRNVFHYVEPEPDEINAVQRAWLQDCVNRVEAVLYGPDFTNAQSGYRALLDVDSFIDFHLFSEVTKNVDAFRFSTFYHLDRGGKLKMGPVWDWNLSLGNADGKQGYMPEHWLWPQLNDQEYSWFRRLFEDPDFGQRYVDRWGQLRTNVFATSNVVRRIRELVAEVSEAQARNFKRWEIIGRDVNPNYFIGESYAEEVDWMQNWFIKRLAWIEAQFVPAPTLDVGANATLRTTASNATVYLTLDGTDPRAPGGGLSAQARPYNAPVAVPPGTKLFARTRAGTRWSPPTVWP